MGEVKAKKEEEKNEKKKPAAKKVSKEPKEVKKESKKDSKTDVAAKKAPVVKKESKGPAGARLKKFFRGSVNELKKVHWPNKQQLIAFTSVVVVSVLVIATLIWVVDSGLTQLVKLVLKK